MPDEFLWTWKFFHRIFWNLENILNTFIDLVSLIFMEIWSTLAKVLPKKPVLLPKIMYFSYFLPIPSIFDCQKLNCKWSVHYMFLKQILPVYLCEMFAMVRNSGGPFCSYCKYDESGPKVRGGGTFLLLDNI